MAAGMKTILIEKADTLDEGLRSVFDVIDNGGHNRLTKGEFVQLLVEREKKEKQYVTWICQFFRGYGVCLGMWMGQNMGQHI